MFYTTNLSVDQYWWWVVHLWVEATWEVLVGCIMAWGLMKTLGVRRRIVTTSARRAPPTGTGVAPRLRWWPRRPVAGWDAALLRWPRHGL